MSVRSGSEKSEKNSTRKKGDSTTGSSSKKGQGLMEAVINKDLKAAKAAIKQGANINMVDEQGWTPLRKAGRLGDISMISLLLQNGGSVTDADRIIVTAASWGRVDVLRLILDAKGVVGDGTDWDTSPLVCAASHGHLRTVKLLIEYQADVNAKDKKGKEALMAAWESNKPDIVFYLVEMGATMKKQDDWTKLAASSSTAIKIAEGIDTRQKRVFREAALHDTVSADTFKPEIKIPLVALCKWLEQVPVASLVLLDRVLFLNPKDTPTRVNLKGEEMRTFFNPINEWAPKEEPGLLEFAPKDTETGQSVQVKVLHQDGVMQTAYFFALTLSSTTVFTSIANQAVLMHAWNKYVRFRFLTDFVLEVLSVALLFAWWCVMMSDEVDFTYESRDASNILLQCCFAVVMMVNIRDMYEEWRHAKAFIKAGRLKNFSYASHSVDYGRIVMSISWIAVHIYANPFDMGPNIKYDASMYTALILLSYVIFARWMMVQSYLRGFKAIGPRVIPIINSMKAVTPFVLISVTLVLGFIHAICVLGDYSGRHITVPFFWDLSVSIYELTIMKVFDLEKLVGVYELDHIQAITNMWFLLMSLSMTVFMSTILVAILDEQFDFQQERGLSQFLIARAHLCFGYMLAINAENPADAPVEKLCQKIFPRLFKCPEKIGYVWACYKVDEMEQSDEIIEQTQGRLGSIKLMTTLKMKKTYKNLHDHIQEVQQRIYKEMKLTQGYITKTREDLIEKCDLLMKEPDDSADEASSEQ